MRQGAASGWSSVGGVISRLALVAICVLGCQRRDAPARESGSATPPSAPVIAPTQKLQTAPPPALPATLPGERRDITALAGTAQRAAIGDLTGDGKAELVLADPDHLRVLDPASGKVLASLPAPGGIQVLEVIDGRVLAGWGESREHRDAPARISAYRLQGGTLTESVIATPATSRAEVTAIVPAPGGALLVAYYESKYMVHAALARETRGRSIDRRSAAKQGSPTPWPEGPPEGRGGWALSDLATIRMAPLFAYADLDGSHHPALVIGRIYGDARGQDGDAFLLRPDGTRVTLPTVRGVRGLVAADPDGDGRDEVFVADGWHQSYAQLARPLLTRIRAQGAGFQAEVIEELPGEYTAGKLLAADLDGDHRPEIISVGSHYVRVFRRAGTSWVGTTVATVARDVAAGDLDGRPGAELVILGDRSEIVRLSR